MKLTLDMLAGALFFVLGACFLAVGSTYPMGTATQMGPGYFPIVVAVGVMVFGAMAAMRSYLNDEDTKLNFNFRIRPFVFVFLAVIAFSLLISSFGLVPALAAAVILSRLAAPTSFIELVTLVVVILSAIVGIFVYALGVPLTLGV